MNYLQFNARWLIFLVFAFATLWKIISPDYINGSFFRYTLLTDARFANVTDTLTNFSYEMAVHNQETLTSIILYDSVAVAGEMQGHDEVANIATFFTFWTVFIEGTIAILFLLPGTAKIVQIRSWSILLFLFTTYIVAPVVAFGWLLSIMGIAQSDSQHRFIRIMFFIAFIFVLLYTIPISEISYDLFNMRLPTSN